MDAFRAGDLKYSVPLHPKSTEVKFASPEAQTQRKLEMFHARYMGNYQDPK